MASYFEEHDCEPTDRNSRGQNDSEPHTSLLDLVRALLGGGTLPEWVDEIVNNPYSDSDALAPPASIKTVADLKRRGITSEEYEEDVKCPVCIVQFSTEDILVELPCEHAFHDHCILPWLKKTNSCPNCRDELPTDNEAYENKKKEKLLQKEREAREQEYQNAMFG